jgi:hypothetical protein
MPKAKRLHGVYTIGIPLLFWRCFFFNLSVKKFFKIRLKRFK